MALRALGWGYAAFPHPLPSGVASYVARNCCKRLRLATASTYENFSPRRAHEGLRDPGDRRGHDHQDPSGHNRDEEPRARSLRLSSQPHIYPVPQDVGSTGLGQKRSVLSFLARQAAVYPATVEVVQTLLVVRSGRAIGCRIYGIRLAEGVV